MNATINSRVSIRMLLAALLGVACAMGSSAATPARVSCKIARALQGSQPDDLVMIDIRSASEFGQEHIAGARSVPLAVLSQATFTRTASLVVYCNEGSCPLSENAASTLVSAGYSNVRVLDGGLAGWKQLGFPVDSSMTTHASTILSRDLSKNLGGGGPAILDVRTAPEFLAGHLPGATNIPLETLSSNLTVLSSRPNWVVYDRQATRSRAAAALIASQGLGVRELVGGIAAWAGDRYPLEVGAAAPRK